ncbi:MAG: methyltransferase domain-containing protein [Paracoccaceae bacterium]
MQSPQFRARQFIKKLEITHTYFAPESEVLKFGCGTGTTAVPHAPFVKHIHAIDVSIKTLELAEVKVKAANVSNLTLACDDIEKFSENG